MPPVRLHTDRLASSLRENKKMHMNNRRSKVWKVLLSNFLDNVSGLHATLLQSSQMKLVEIAMPPTFSCWWLPEPAASRQHTDDSVPSCVCRLTLQSERTSTALLYRGVGWTELARYEWTVDFTNETQNICRMSLIRSLYFEELNLLFQTSTWPTNNE